MSEPRSFDVCGPLPTGVTVLEASAGTGKTFTIAALAARYVADGVPLERLLLVTFTRMATGELRERVRERLVSAEQALGRALAGVRPGDRDGVVRLLAAGSLDEVERRRARLARALSDFDAATIATTHGFCQEVLAGLGVAGDVDAGATVVEDIADLLAEVVDDLYVRRFHRHGQPQFSRAEAMQIARLAVENPAAPLEPRAAGPDTIEGMRVRLAEVVRTELALRKRRSGILTYDDLLTRLDDTLVGAGGAEASARLRTRYRVVLVDEFQDTDPVQWSILRRAFGGGDVTLVLIGDPKQAIYAFRGADVFAYLDAARSAGARATLDVNWRSDQGLLDAYDALLGGARLGHAEIAYRTVRAADANRAPRLHGAPAAAPLRVRVVHRDDPAVELTRTGLAAAPATREYIARDLAGDIARLLSSDAEVECRDQAGVTLRRDPVRPGHAAVLVRTHRHAAAIRDALAGAGVPAVINGAGSVFGTAPARDWLALLEAIERPASAAPARTAALTPFLGWTPGRIAAAGEPELETLHARLHEWAHLLRSQGIASLAEAITTAERLPGRMLGSADGERRLTDLRHVGQLLHEAAAAGQLGVTALAAWLRARIAAAEREAGDEDRTRRLESDAEAVQVLTIHRSKGLEFPVVYLPYLWEPTWLPDRDEPLDFHDPATGDERTLDVGMGGPDWREHQRLHRAEQRGEDLRLAYVALTRAQHQTVLWWAGSMQSRHSALGRLLFARDGDGNVAWQGRRTPGDAEVVERLGSLGAVAVERAGLALPAYWSPAPAVTEALEVAAFARELDRTWRRTSYSDLTAGAHEARVASEPDGPDVRDEPEAPGAPSVRAGGRGDEARLRAVASPLGTMEGGIRAGTFVHRVLEAVDFAAPDLDRELAARVAAEHQRRAAVGDAAAVVAGLRAALRTPLGPVLGGRSLRDVARADRLDELAFELPLAGADRPTGRLELTVVAEVLRRHGGDLAGYAERLADPGLRQAVRGYLTGSIDLVVRVRDGAGGRPRFALVDYKTNRLALPDEPLSAWHYRPEALAAEMERSHYGLQALLYAVALHRYLRWRLPGYDPGRDLAGVLYLFVRGMSGPATPVVDGVPCGVFGWRPSAALVSELSDVLDRGVAA